VGRPDDLSEEKKPRRRQLYREWRHDKPGKTHKRATELSRILFKAKEPKRLVKQAMVNRGKELRNQLAECSENNDFSALGEVVRDENSNRILAIRFRSDRQGKENFRCLMALAMDEKKNGGAKAKSEAKFVNMRSVKGYDGCELFTSIDGKAGLGSSEDGTFISIFKSGGAKNLMVDLARSAQKITGADQLGCHAQLSAYYYRFGFDYKGVVPLSPAQRVKGWRKRDTKALANEAKNWQVRSNKTEKEVALPFVLMRLNPDRFAEVDSTGEMLPAPEQKLDSGMLLDLPQYPNHQELYKAGTRMRERDRPRQQQSISGAAA
jgi:hypothetical protein